MSWTRTRPRPMSCCKTHQLAAAIAGGKTGPHWLKEPRGLRKRRDENNKVQIMSVLDNEWRTDDSLVY